MYFTLYTRLIKHPLERASSAQSKFENKIWFRLGDPLLRLLLGGLSGPQVLPPLLQHVGIEDERA
jgi:hypothetical protein